MLKWILASASLAFSLQAPAMTIVDMVVMNQQQAIEDLARIQNLNWKVGDETNYSLDMGFIKGSMQMRCREIAADGIWLDQKADLGFAGKQDVQVLLDPNTGEIKKMIVNGQEQQPPKNTMEVVEMKEDRITVPAGTYDAIHVLLRDKADNKESNIWVNPQEIPLSGMLKSIQPSQFGNVTLLLKSFKKN